MSDKALLGLAMWPATQSLYASNVINSSNTPSMPLLCSDCYKIFARHSVARNVLPPHPPLSPSQHAFFLQITAQAILPLTPCPNQVATPSPSPFYPLLYDWYHPMDLCYLKELKFYIYLLKYLIVFPFPLPILDCQRTETLSHATVSGAPCILPGI